MTALLKNKHKLSEVSLPYIFDSLQQSAGEKDAHHCIAVVVKVSNCPRAVRRWWVKQPSKGALNGLPQTTQTADSRGYLYTFC